MFGNLIDHDFQRLLEINGQDGSAKVLSDHGNVIGKNNGACRCRFEHAHCGQLPFTMLPAVDAQRDSGVAQSYQERASISAYLASVVAIHSRPAVRRSIDVQWHALRELLEQRAMAPGVPTRAHVEQSPIAGWPFDELGLVRTE